MAKSHESAQAATNLSPQSVQSVPRSHDPSELKQYRTWYWYDGGLVYQYLLQIRHRSGRWRTGMSPSRGRSPAVPRSLCSRCRGRRGHFRTVHDTSALGMVGWGVTLSFPAEILMSSRGPRRRSLHRENDQVAERVTRLEVPREKILSIAREGTSVRAQGIVRRSDVFGCYRTLGLGTARPSNTETDKHVKLWFRKSVMQILIYVTADQLNDDHHTCA